MEYNDLVELYKMKLLKKYEDLQEGAKMQPNDNYSNEVPINRGELVEMILNLTDDQCKMVIERFQQALAQSKREEF